MDFTSFFKLMAEKHASDMFLSAGAPVQIKIEGEMMPVNSQVLDSNVVKKIIYSIMNEEQIQEFESTLEMNFGYSVPQIGRFRVNVFRQRGSVAMVARYLNYEIPSLESLGLPPALKDLTLEKRGLVLVVGSTGSGKSTTLASMIDYRNTHKRGHILTIEDPVEFTHKHKKSIVNQREVGIDTMSYATALMNAMREAPDVLLIGEIRDQEAMKQALIYTQTGHLCLATLHANNAHHAMNRIISFFPHEMRDQLLLDLSLSLRGVISQRLVRGVDGKRLAAVEVLLNSLHISELIQKGEIEKIREAMEQSMLEGSQTFEEALIDLYEAGKISLETAKQSADSRTNIEWLISNSSKRKENAAKRHLSAIKIEEHVATVESDPLPELTLSPEMLNQIGVTTIKQNR